MNRTVSGAGIHTYTQGRGYTHKHTDIRTETILRNQARAGLWPACAWFNKIANYSNYAVLLCAVAMNMKII